MSMPHSVPVSLESVLSKAIEVTGVQPTTPPVSGGGASQEAADESPRAGYRHQIANWHPVYDVKKDPKEVTVMVDLPGVDEDDVLITMAGTVLFIDGEREFDHDSEDADEYVKVGRPYGAYHCAVPLEEDVDFEQATAKYKRGVLKVRIPRK